MKSLILTGIQISRSGKQFRFLLTIFGVAYRDDPVLAQEELLQSIKMEPG